MASLSRLWFVLPPEPGLALGDVVAQLARRPLAALLHDPDPASVEVARSLGALGAPNSRPLGSAGLAELDGLAAEHADCEFALVAGPQLLLAAVARALGTQRQAPARPRPGSLSAFHWPTGADPQARAELIGLDLDWFPPWTSGQPRSRFPGGPGVAGSARS